LGFLPGIISGTCASMIPVPSGRKTPDMRYLVKKRRTWYVRVAVPPKLVPIARKTHVVRSLGTRDLSVARERRWQVLADIKAALAALRVDPVAEGLDWRDYRMHQDKVIRDPDTRMTRREEAEVDIADRAEQIEAKQGREDALTFFRVAKAASPTLVTVEKRWLAEIKDEVTAQTLGNHQHALGLLHKFDPGLLFVNQVDRRVAGDFVTEAVRPGRQPATINRIISSLSSFWAWMVDRGLAEANPWGRQGVKRRNGTTRTKRPYTAGELVKLLQADPVTIIGPRYGGAIRDLLRLGLLTGARLDELCELQAADVDPKAKTISIRQGKTEAARRTIPVHRAIWPIVVRRVEGAKGGPLFPELAPGGPDHKRSWHASKRFTVFRRSVLGDGDSTVDYHSLRRTFATYLDHAQGRSKAIYPSLIAQLMGHEKPNLALSAYSGGSLVDHLRKAIDAMGRVIEPGVLEAVAVCSSQLPTSEQAPVSHHGKERRPAG
jgi:integrase